MKKIISFLLTAALLFCIFPGCSDTGKTKVENSDKMSIVTTIFPYYDFAKNVTGDKAKVSFLLSPGSEPHDYEPSPSDIVNIENCDIFIYNGGESEEWVENVLKSLQNKDMKIMCMSDYVDLICEEEHEEHHHEHEEEEEHEHEYDEHIWTSPKNAMLLTEKICETAVACDAENQQFYRTNSENYIAQLSVIDNEFREIVKNGKRNTLVFGDRFPFAYLAEEYGLEHEAAFPGCSSETEPSIATVTHLIDYVRDNQIPIVFYLEFSNGKIANLISEDSNARSLRISSCHNVTKREFESGVSYISLMEQNAKAVKEALS